VWIGLLLVVIYARRGIDVSKFVRRLEPDYSGWVVGWLVLPSFLPSTKFTTISDAFLRLDACTVVRDKLKRAPLAVRVH
jgi:hypothetical protein